MILAIIFSDRDLISDKYLYQYIFEKEKKIIRFHHHEFNEFAFSLFIFVVLVLKNNVNTKLYIYRGLLFGYYYF